jgi:hypothetical protein
MFPRPINPTFTSLSPFPSSAQHQQPNSTADSVEQAAYQKAEGSRTKTDYDHL